MSNDIYVKITVNLKMLKQSDIAKPTLGVKVPNLRCTSEKT